MLSGYVLSVPSSFSLSRSRWSIPSYCRPSCAVSMLTVSVIGERFALAEGRLPMRLVPSEPLGSCGGSTYIALHRTWLVSANCRVPLELSSVFHILLRDVPHVFMAIILSVSLTPACP